MKKEIRDRRHELYKKSKTLKELAFDERRTDDIREKQQELYKKWQFYDNLIKASEKGKK